MRLSAVVPAYNEARGLGTFVDALAEELRRLCESPEIILVDDGSTDGTWDRIVEASVRIPEVRGIRLTRNFGKEMAILAGLRASTGDAVIVLDADGQHPVSLLPRMVDAWKSHGAPVVEAVKRARQREGPWRRFASEIFYRCFRWTTGMDLIGSSDFKLLDREAVDAYLALPERRRFFRGLVRWLGYPAVEISFVPPDRAEGRSGWSSLRLASFAWSSLKAFTIAPLRIVAILGALTLAAAVVLGAQTLYRWWTGSAVPGFATVILLQLLVGSVLMIALGVLGEYLGQVYEEVKGRPPYVVADWTGDHTAGSSHEAEAGQVRDEPGRR